MGSRVVANNLRSQVTSYLRTETISDID